jgi:hypothetical protein
MRTPCIKVGSAVRLRGASGKLGDITNIYVFYATEEVTVTILVETANGPVVYTPNEIAPLFEIAPLEGTIT